MAYATVCDLERRWHVIPPSEGDKAEALLEDAAAMLDAEFRRSGKFIDETDDLLMSVLRVVSCAMVKRVLATSIDGDYSQVSQTAGSFTEQLTMANPGGGLYLTSNERNMLGIPIHGQRIGQLMYRTSDNNEG